MGPLIACILGLVWPFPWISKPGWFSYLHSFLLAHGEHKGHVWCYTCFFHQWGCTLYKHVYSRLAFQTSLVQQLIQWMAQNVIFGTTQGVCSHPVVVAAVNVPQIFHYSLISGQLRLYGDMRCLKKFKEVPKLNWHPNPLQPQSGTSFQILH